MTPVLGAAAALLASYLIGAVPFALVAGRLRGIDLREHGSGNLGATNAVRVLGRPVGLTVFCLDFLKGFVPVLMARAISFPWEEPERLAMAFACGAAAVLGHVFPVYLKFKGGKGVAATAGVLLAVRWDAALLAFAVFFAVRRLTGFVSASSMALAVAFPAALFLFHGREALGLYRWITVGGAGLAVLIITRHRANLVRIARGTEPRVGRSKPKEGA